MIRPGYARRVGTTELRVHGVAGGNVEAMLGSRTVVQVDGDRRAGFYRPREAGVDDRTGVTVEAYRWSNLTAGTAGRAFSLVLLLPFMLVNLAVWMCSPRHRAGVLARTLCRLLAALITVLSALTAVGVLLDLLAWQCASEPVCRQRAHLSWLDRMTVGQRMALVAAGFVALIALASYLGSRSWWSQKSGGGYWDNRALLSRLRWIHAALALATVDASLLIALVSADPRRPGYALLGGLAAVVAGCLVMLCLPAVADRFDAGVRAHRVTRALGVAAMVLTGLTFGYVAASPDVPASGSLPGFEATLAFLFVGQALLLATLTATSLTRRYRPGDPPAFLHGLGPAVILSVALDLMVTFGAGLTYWFADLLDGGFLHTALPTLPGGVPPLQPANVYRWAAVSPVITVPVAALTWLTWGRLTLRRRRREADEIIRQDFPSVPPHAERLVRAVRDALVRARFVERLGPLLIMYLLLGVFSLSLAGLAVADVSPGHLAARLAGPGAGELTDLVTDAGAYLIGLLGVVLAVCGLLAYRSRLIRSVGVLWDLATFWPRTAHPFAPPCYAERAVPQLVERTRRLAEDGGVILSGHSHGAVLVAATVLRLPPSTRRRVALLTSGSPLRRLYSRLFPAYFNADRITVVGEQVRWRWLNLWRETDPVGGWVFSPRPPEQQAADRPPRRCDWRLPDPRTLLAEGTVGGSANIEGHSRYHTDEDYAAAVRQLARTVA
jgi:hypothetical protein